jgi:hypothetical protein
MSKKRKLKETSFSHIVPMLLERIKNLELKIKNLWDLLNLREKKLNTYKNIGFMFKKGWKETSFSHSYVFSDK